MSPCIILLITVMGVGNSCLLDEEPNFSGVLFDSPPPPLYFGGPSTTLFHWEDDCDDDSDINENYSFETQDFVQAILGSSNSDESVSLRKRQPVALSIQEVALTPPSTR